MRRSRTRLAVAAALVAVATAGCGSTGIGTGPAATFKRTPATNGLEKKTAAQVERAAVAALKSAGSVHMKGSGTFDGDRERLDLRLQGSSFTGTIIVDGATVGVTLIGHTLYMKADRKFWQHAGMPAGAIPFFAGRWLKGTEKSNYNLARLTLPAIVKSLTVDNGPLQPAVKQTSLNGRKAVVISERNGAKLYVANTGRADILHLEARSADWSGRYDFSEHGKKVRITAPRDALDMDALD